MSLEFFFLFITLILSFAILQMLGKIALQRKKISELNNEKILLLDLIDFVYQNIHSKELLSSFCNLISSKVGIVEIVVDKNGLLSNKNITAHVLFEYVKLNQSKMHQMLKSNKVIIYNYQNDTAAKYNLYITYSNSLKEDFIIFISNMHNKKLQKINVERFIETLSFLIESIKNMQK